MSAHILIVDDSPLVAAVVSRFIEREGYCAQSVPDGQAALDAVRGSPPDLILLDVTMPPPDGFDVCRQLKQNSSTALIPIILLTGLDDFSASKRGVQVGADDVLTKPFDPPHLLARVRALLQRQPNLPADAGG